MIDAALADAGIAPDLGNLNLAKLGIAAARIARESFA